MVSGESSPEAEAIAVTTRVISSAYGRDSSTRCWALTMREAAMSSIARVIFLVEDTERMRRRRTLICAATS